MPAKNQSLPPTPLAPPRHRHSFHPFLGLFFIVVGIVLAVLMQYGNIARLSYKTPAEPEVLANPIVASQPLPEVTSGVGPVIGKSDAPITIVEFTDYACPLCAEYFVETFPAIKKNYIDTGKVQYEFRNYPLSEIHPHAFIASEALLCAWKEEAFSPMHSMIFKNQAAWSVAEDPLPLFTTYAKTLQLNMESLTNCLTTHETARAIDFDTKDAENAGINGTPTFWVFHNGKQVLQINGAYPYEYFEQSLNALLQPPDDTTPSPQ